MHPSEGNVCLRRSAPPPVTSKSPQQLFPLFGTAVGHENFAWQSDAAIAQHRNFEVTVREFVESMCQHARR